MGPLTLLFWTSGDVSSGFQTQGGQPYSHLVDAYVLHVLNINFKLTLNWNVLASFRQHISHPISNIYYSCIYMCKYYKYFINVHCKLWNVSLNYHYNYHFITYYHYLLGAVGRHSLKSNMVYITLLCMISASGIGPVTLTKFTWFCISSV